MATPSEFSAIVEQIYSDMQAKGYNGTMADLALALSTLSDDNPATTKWIDLGASSAYAIYVEHGGTMSEAEWIEYLSSVSEKSAQAHADAQSAKESAEAAEQAKTDVTEEAEQAITNIQTEGQTQITAVTNKGTEQVGAVNTAGTTQVNAVNAAGTTQVNAVNTAGSTQITAVQAQGTASKDSVTAEGEKQIERVANQGTTSTQAVTAEGTRQIGLVTAEGTTQVGLVTAEGTTQVGNVNSAGNTQVSTVNSAGSTQITNIQNKGDTVLASIPEDYTTLNNEVEELKSRVPKYGASGFANENPTLTRLYDAIGLVAEVGTDGDNSLVRNDFDDLAPFNRKKCVGHWEAGTDRAVFVVEAYESDPDYAEDGTMGDYVAVDCTPAYVWESEDGDIRAVSPVKLNGFRPFACLASKDNPAVCREHTYLPVYALAFDENGHAVSLPGYSNRQGDYASLLNAAKQYANTDVQQYCHLMPDDVAFYEETLYDIEFATHNCQSIMQGCAGLRHSNDDRVEMVDATHWIIKNYYASRVAGEFVSIQPVSIDINSAKYYASHKIVSIERCDADGTPNASGTCQLITTEDLGLGRTYEAGTEYRIAARPYNTGACSGVSTPSGSPVSNSDSFHPMKYRHRENVFGNQFQTTMDLFDLRIGEEGAYELEWYKMKDLDAGVARNYSAADMEGDNFVKLGYVTPTEDYKSGYITDEVFDRRYPDNKIPVVGTGGSASKYVCDYAYLVSSAVLRSVRRFGNWNNGSNDGFGNRNANNAPSNSNANYGGGLNPIQCVLPSIQIVSLEVRDVAT